MMRRPSSLTKKTAPCLATAQSYRRVDEFLGYRHCEQFFHGVRPRICIGRIIINLGRHYDNLDGNSKLWRRRYRQCLAALQA